MLNKRKLSTQYVVEERKKVHKSKEKAKKSEATIKDNENRKKTNIWTYG